MLVNYIVGLSAQNELQTETFLFSTRNKIFSYFS